MTKAKKVFRVTAIILAALVLLTAIFSVLLYRNGNLIFAHRLKDPKDSQTRVACVGDSITYGSGIKGWPNGTYPDILGNMLGDSYIVNNYGYSGRTALHNADKPYINENLYQQSLDFNPDIVIIMLGTNDTKPYNWKGKEAFIDDYKKIIESYAQLDSEPEIYVIMPPPCTVIEGATEVKFDINGELINTDVCDAVKEIAEELNINLIDANTQFQGKENLFSDGVHPNNNGAKIFAEIVYDRIIKNG